MATNERTIAIAAALLVAVSFLAGSGFFGSSTGAATLGTVDAYDFSVKSIEFPAKISRWDDFTAKATFENTRPIPATFVTYDYKIMDVQGRVQFQVREGPSAVQLPSGTSTSSLEKTSVNSAGTYTVKVTIDYLNQFKEADEGNNVYTTTIKVV